MKAAQSGDLSARNWLIRTWTTRIYSYVFRMIGKEEDAKDLTQEILAKTLKTLHRFDHARPFAPWIYRIARNACIDHQRRQRLASGTLVEDLPDPSATPLERAQSHQESTRLRKALETIPSKYREIIVLYHFEHMKYEEISHLLRIPMGTVMNRLFRARKLLKSAIEQQGVIPL